MDIQNPQNLSRNDTTSYYYLQTKFDFIDTLDCWEYDLDKNYKSDRNDSISPIAIITFFRTKPLNDSISLNVYNKPWMPLMSFEIFYLKDSSFCFQESKRTVYFSSCVPPSVGGDLFIIGDFIFLNRNVCVECRKPDSGIDYCRPLINHIISKIDKNKIKTIDDITAQFSIIKKNRNGRK